MACASPPSNDHLFECPVCFDTMNEPKILQCGHSVCSSCVDNLTTGGYRAVQCPTCRHNSAVPLGGFPTNFALSDPIRGDVNEQEKLCHKCMMCDKMNVLEDMIICHTCGDMSLCLHCAFLSHAHDGRGREELAIQQEHNKAIADGQELASLMSSLLLSDDSTDASANSMTEPGILFIDDRSISLCFPNSNTTTELVDIDMHLRLGHAMGVLSDGRVMVAGGAHPDSSFEPASTEIIDLVSKQVTEGPPMSTASRSFASSDMIGGEMFLCGGKDEEDDTLASCEVYRENEEWSTVADMVVPRQSHAVVALDGLLYAIGGFNYTDVALDSVECYNPDTNTWEPVASLSHKRHSLAAAALNGYIYAAGGMGGRDICERYDPTQNEWQRVADMNEGRPYLSLVSLGDKLYALGGDEEKTVESYDVENDEWKMEDVTLMTCCQSAVVLNYSHSV